MMTEERLAHVEALIAEQGKDIAEMRSDVKKLMEITNMGKGALWFVLKTGMVLVGVAGFVKLLWDAFGARH